MSSFTTRVELHAANYNDYETLHAAMAKEGFKRTVTSDSGVTYHLPTAEYNREAQTTRGEVLASAKRAALKTLKKHAILVTESAGRTWDGLEIA